MWRSSRLREERSGAAADGGSGLPPLRRYRIRRPIRRSGRGPVTISTVGNGGGESAARPEAARLGYVPALDGLRGVSVLAVLAYHAGFGWMHGGFLGVEVFFVVSGYLITALLLDEQATAGWISLRRFWIRRARRLLPALICVLLAVSLWAALFGSAEQRWQLRRDLPWALGYLANWGQIVGGVPYFAATDPPLLRHLWSLAVEEQWYLVWPVAFVVIARRPSRHARRLCALALVAAAAAVATWMGVVSQGEGPLGSLGGADRTNFLYLSTFTRSSGLLIGAALAFAWRPSSRSADGSGGARPRRLVQVAAGAGAVVIAVAFVVARLTAGGLYRWGLPLVSVSSAALIAAAVSPRPSPVGRALEWRPLVAIGRRSYGLYLWSWPISVVCSATDGSTWRVVGALMLTAVVAESCFRFVESPIRRDGLAVISSFRARHPIARSTIALAAAGAVTAGAIIGLAGFYAAAQPFNPAADRSTPELVAAPIELVIAAGPVPPGRTGTDPTTQSADAASADAATSGSAGPKGSATAPDDAAPGKAVSGNAAAGYAVSRPGRGASAVEVAGRDGPPAAPPVTSPRLPRRIVVVGDSQAEAFTLNLPAGMKQWFVFGDGSVNGCSVYDEGKVVTERKGFGRSFEDCAGWERRWAKATAAADADLALVMLGAWDVFDRRLDDSRVLVFGTRAADEEFVDRLQHGIDALRFSGAEVALLEIPCMRPVEARGAAVPPLPERGDDDRIEHLNVLLRRLADADPEHVTFVEGPDEWCNGDPLATDTSYRWDGVHSSRRGAKLTFDTIAVPLLEIPL